MIKFEFRNPTPLTQKYKVTMTGYGPTWKSVSIVLPNEVLTLTYDIDPPSGTVLNFTVEAKGRVIHTERRVI